MSSGLRPSRADNTCSELPFSDECKSRAQYHTTSRARPGIEKIAAGHFDEHLASIAKGGVPFPRCRGILGVGLVSYLERKDGLIRGEGPEVAPDEGVTGRPPLRSGCRRGLLHRGRRRHGPEKYPVRWTPPLAGKVGGSRRRVSDEEPGGTIHQRRGAAEPGAADAAPQRLGGAALDLEWRHTAAVGGAALKSSVAAARCWVLGSGAGGGGAWGRQRWYCRGREGRPSVSVTREMRGASRSVQLCPPQTARLGYALGFVP